MNANRPLASELDHTVIEQAIVSGSRPAFVRLYHHYEGNVRYGVARAALKLGYGREVEELVQEVWCRLLNKNRRLLSYYDPERGPFGRYIKWVAYQQALVVSHQQRRKAFVHRLPSDGDELVDDQALGFVFNVIQSDIFQKVLDRVDAELSEAERVLLREHHLGERTLRDVAQELGVKEDTIYQRNHRLKKKLVQIGEQLQPRRSPPSASTSKAMGLLVQLLVVQLCGGDQPEDHDRGDGSPSATVTLVA